jgi:hypothetical protein
MVSRNIRFTNEWCFRLPDYVNFICEDCASKKEASKRVEFIPMKTMCDVCECVKPNVAHSSNYNFAEYVAGSIKVRKWKRTKDSNIERSDE